jgi:hypothetical protein
MATKSGRMPAEMRDEIMEASRAFDAAVEQALADLIAVDRISNDTRNRDLGTLQDRLEAWHGEVTYHVLLLCRALEETGMPPFGDRLEEEHWRRPLPDAPARQGIKPWKLGEESR